MWQVATNELGWGRGEESWTPVWMEMDTVNWHFHVPQNILGHVSICILQEFGCRGSTTSEREKSGRILLSRHFRVTPREVHALFRFMSEFYHPLLPPLLVPTPTTCSPPWLLSFIITPPSSPSIIIFIVLHHL